MSGFTAVDLSQLTAPDLIETVDYEVILTEMKADLISRNPAMEDVLALESEPSLKILEVAALRETIVRQRVNEAAKATMLAYALSNDLNHRGANFSVERLLITPADPGAVPPIDAVYESDDDFRRRIQLSLEGFSTAGPEGAYIFHVLSAAGDVLDASATAPAFSKATIDQAIMDQLPSGSIVLQVDDAAGLTDPLPGDVAVAVLSRTADGTANQTLLDAVTEGLSDDVIPLTDHPVCSSATIINYTIDATLYFFAGPDRAVVMAAAQTAIDEYTETHHRLGLDITLSGIYAALHQSGVQRVDLVSPANNIVIDRQSAAYCTGTTLTDGGLDE